MKTRRVGPFEVSAIGLGCMNLSHAYGAPPPEAAAQALLREALDLGITFFDTAALYGFGANEELVGRTLAADREKFVLASKCGLHGVNDGSGFKRVVDGRPDGELGLRVEMLYRLRHHVGGGVAVGPAAVRVVPGEDFQRAVGIDYV